MFKLAAAAGVIAQASAFTLIPYDDFNEAFDMLEFCQMTATANDLSSEATTFSETGAVDQTAAETYTYATGGTEATCTANGGTWTTRISEDDWNATDLEADNGLWVAEVSATVKLSAAAVEYWAWEHTLYVSDIVPQDPGQPTFIVFRAASEDAAAMEDKAEVTAVMPLPSELKRTPNTVVAEDTYGADADSLMNINVRLAPGIMEDEAAVDELAAAWQSVVDGAGVSGVTVTGRSVSTVTLSSVPGTALQTIDEVLQDTAEAEFVDVLPKVRATNYNAAWITSSGELTDAGNPTMWAHGLHGENQVVAVADTGVDYQSSFFLDGNEDVTFTTDQFGFNTFVSDTHRKIAQYVAYANGVEDGDDGHGTHVAGSVLGQTGNTATDADPNSGGGLVTNQPFTDFNGIAYESRLAFFDIGTAAGGLDVPPSLDATMFPYAGDVDAFIHSNSWGAPVNTYDGFAVGVDTYSWNNQDFLVLFANGNDGPGAATVGTPATAKNSLSVGASVNYYPGFDPVTEVRLADFSSRGPTSDGRIKPDISAPGFFVISAASRMTGATGHTTLYETAGTSMATPVTAGTASLLRQYFTEGWYPTGEQNADHAFTPMGSLLKAMLIDGGVELASQNGGTLTQGTNALPNMDAGFGRVTTDNTVYFADTSEHTLFVHGEYSADCGDCPMANQDSVTSYEFEVQGGTPFKATLVWADFPGSTTATKVLVNDLDLIVASDAPTTFPNGGTQRDSLNNVEKIVIEEPLATTYTVQVVGTNVAQGPQPYSLVVTGAFKRTASLFPAAAPTVTPGSVTVSSGRILVNGENFHATASQNEVDFTCETLTQTAPTGTVTDSSSTSLIVEVTSEGTCTSNVHMTVSTGDFTTDPVILAADSTTDGGLAETVISDSTCAQADDETCNSFAACKDAGLCDTDESSFDAAAVFVPIVLVVGVLGAAVYFKKNPSSWNAVKGVFGADKGTAVPTSQFAAAGAGPASPSAVEMRPAATMGGVMPPPPRPMSSTLPDGWERACTAEGETYYFNTLTGASTWDRPVSMAGGSRRMAQGGEDQTTWT